MSWDVDGNSFLQNRASSDTSQVERNSPVSRKPSHVAFFLVRRRLTGIHTSEWRVHWPLSRSGEGSGTSGRAELVQADAGRSSIHRFRRGHSELKQRVFSTQRRRWNTDRSLRTNVKQLYETIVRSNEMFKEMNHVKTKDQQWYRVVPDACDVRKTRTQYMSVSRHIEFRCLDGGTRAKDQ